MGNFQYKNTLNNIKNKLTLPEHSDPTTTTPEYPNADEAEEYDFKNNFLKMIEALKQEMKYSLK